MNGSLWHLLVFLVVIGLIIEGVVLIGLLRQMGTFLIHMNPPRPGELPGEGPDPGTPVAPDLVPDHRAAIFLFVSPTCQLCSAVVAGLPALHRNYREIALVPLVVGGTEESKRSYAETLGKRARVDSEHLLQEWRVSGTPFAVGVGPDRRVKMSGVVNSLPQLETLADTLAAPRDLTEPGEPDPATSDNGSHQPARDVVRTGG
jgi:hypothetical protein